MTSLRFNRLMSTASFLAAAAGSTAALAQPGNPCPTDCPQQSRITICYEGGRVDAYTAPNDSTSRRAFFDAFVNSTYPGIIKQFDDATEDRVLGHTFQNLPCGIMSATLEVEMRAGISLTTNDAIYLQYLGGTSMAWGSPISALPGAGGTWNPGQSQTFFLNLAALPGGGNLLPQMNTTHALDFLMQDDTAVEHMRLTITVCPCDGKFRTYTVGAADNLTPPPEPTIRRPRLTALRTIVPFLWKNTDDCTFDRGWGHTFSSIAPGVVRAGFGIRMAPCGGSNNDGLSLDLINDGGPEIFSRGYNINLLPGTGGVWNTNPLTNFAFNLGATSPANVCGPNLLGDFGDRTFDVYVQDDTAVDVARLRVQPCPPLKHIWGIPVHLLGQAEILHNPATGAWGVGNIGSSGQDGVSFDMHRAPGGFFDVFAEPITDWDVGSFFDVFLEGPNVGDDGSPDILAHLNYSKIEWHYNNRAALELRLGGDTPPGTHTITVRNSLTGESTTLPFMVGEVATIGTTEIQQTSWSTSNRMGCRECWDLKKATKLRTTAPIQVGPVIVNGDEVEISSCCNDCDDTNDDCRPPVETCRWSWGVSQSNGTPPRAGFARVGLVATATFSDGTTADITTSALTSNPDCSLDSNPDSLTVGNIGGTGQDGVSIDLPPLDEWSAVLTPICAGLPENCPPDAPIDLSVHFTASINGETGRDAGSSALHRGGQGFFDITYDVSLGGSNGAALVKVFDENGDMTGMFDAPPNGQLMAQGEGEPGGCGKQAIEMGGFRTACLWWDWRKDMLFGRPGLTPIRGRQIRILAGQPTQNFDYLEGVNLNVGSVQEMDIANQRYIPHGVNPPPCYADFNQDGGIDGADVEAFFFAWENGDASADVNGDGGIDGADVETFFFAWENGACP